MLLVVLANELNTIKKPIRVNRMIDILTNVGIDSIIAPVS